MINKLHFNRHETSLKEFKKMLEQSGASKTTIKNYLSDVRSFLDGDSDDKKLSYATIKRRNSSIRKYMLFKNSRRSTYLPLALSGAGFLVIFALVLNNFNDTKEVLGDTNKYVLAIPSNTTINSSGKTVSDDLKMVVKLEPQVSDFQATTPMLSSKPEALPTANGSSKIGKGTKETIIVNSLINSSSYIYLTPYSPTAKQSLYIKQQDEGFAVIAIEEPLNWDLEFQWKVDNTEVYHSIY